MQFENYKTRVMSIINQKLLAITLLGDSAPRRSAITENEGFSAGDK